MEKICVNKLTRNSANQRPSSSWGLIDKTNLQIVPENGLLICTSKLQVKFTTLQVSLSVHINVLCLTVILTVNKI